MKLPRLRLRARIASALTSVRAARPVLGAMSRFGAPWVTVLTYHRVRPALDSGGFDDGVVDATTSELDAHLAVLSRHFEFVGTEDVARWFDGGALPKNPALVTFDDAYKDCRAHALPVLQKHRAPATFFVSTSQVQERRVFWWDRASYVLKKCALERVSLPSWNLDLDLRDRDGAIRRVLRVIKDTFALDIDAFLGALADACHVDWSREHERRMADDLVCTWDDVRALRSAGMEIQSHSRSHRVLQTVPDSELHDELAGSRRDLEDVLREPVRALAYPTGRPVDRSIAGAVQRAGYHLAFENAGGRIRRFPRPSRWMLRRFPLSPGTTPEQLETLLLAPMLQ